MNPGSDREEWTRATARIDWLQGPMHAFDPADGVTEARSAWLLPPAEVRAARPPGMRPPWNRWFEDGCGTCIGYDDEESNGRRQPRPHAAFLILKGSGLTRLRDLGQDDRELRDQFHRWRGRCNRIDIAIDVRHPEITPEAFWQLHRADRLVTRLRGWKYQGRTDQGTTFYSTGDSCMLRVYDKSAERRRKGQVLESGITRIEIELRKDDARRTWLALCGIPGDRWEDDFPEFAKGLVLSKVRPLDIPKPSHNPQRAPLWGPLRDAFGDVATVQLPAIDRQNDIARQLNGHIINASNQRASHRIAHVLMGTAPYLQWLHSPDQSVRDELLLAALQENPDVAEKILTDHGIMRPSDDDQARQTGGGLWQ